MGSRSLTADDVIDMIGDGDDSDFDDSGVGRGSDSDDEDKANAAGTSTASVPLASQPSHCQTSGRGRSLNDDLVQPDSDSEEEEKELGSGNSGGWRRADFQPPQNLTFVGPVREPPLQPNGEPQTPFWYFRQFFDEEIMAKMALWMQNYEGKELEKKDSGTASTSGTSMKTRKRKAPSNSAKGSAKQKNSKTRATRTFVGHTDDRIISDLNAFMACLLTMGIWQHKNVLDYWSNQGGLSAVKEIMSVDRFRLCTRHVCLRNVEDREPTDDEKKQNRVWKAQPFIEHFQRKFSSIEHGEFMAVDEQMISFKHSRSILRQHMPRKPIKYGIKVWAVAAPDGFVTNFAIFQGKTTGLDNAEAKALGLTSSSYIVYKFVKQFDPRYKGCKIFADRYFTDANLPKRLLELGHGFVGTVMPNRLGGSSPLKKDDEMKKRGDFDSVVSNDGKVVAIKWRDNKAVTLVSSYIGVEPLGQVKRYDKKSKSHIHVNCPAVITEYNKKMGGVDKSDFLRQMYKLSMKSRRWYVYLFLYVLQVAVRNAAILRQADLNALGSKTKLDLKTFIWEVRTELAKLSVYSKKLTRDLSIVPEGRFDNVGHWPEIRRNGRIDLRQRCVLCKSNKSDVWCRKCEVPLCFGEKRNCLVLYHEG